MAQSNIRLSPDQRDRIVEMRLDRVPVRTIAKEVGCTPRTVMLWWKKWLAEVSEERRAELEGARTEALARLDKVAEDARKGALRARSNDDPAAEARFLNIEQQAIMSAAKLEGLDVQKVEHSGAVGIMSVTIVEEVAPGTISGGA